ncbi:MAG TPA: phosphonate ABC transporter, permease protein PhnE [Anaerolineae bacterium]|nr:phosphonate ABC transporter, permease protein PhnE [Anaerolineae bacterium]
MTAAAAQASHRPTKPPRSRAIYAGLVAFVAITLVSVSEEWGIGLDLGSIVEDLGNGRVILEQLLAPNWAFLPRVVDPLLETFQIAVVAAFIGCGLALPISFFASRTTVPNHPTLTVSRGLLSVVRAIPDFLYALLFVAAVGIGPLPGILALIFFNVGVVAKLLSETVDSVDTGPIEAVDAGGSTRTQMVRWAVLPQVLPNYVAFSLYAFELNVRASTVLGFVGAGGIGFLLRVQYQFGFWSNVSVIIICLFFIVFAIELVSIRLRRRLV